MEPADDPRSLSDRALLVEVRKGKAARLARTIGCPAVAFLSAAPSLWAARWLGDLTWEPLLWLFFPLIWFGLGATSAGVLLGVVGAGRAPLWREARRRVGQLTGAEAVASIEAELADRAPGQRGWVVVLRRGVPGSPVFHGLRVDLRTDISPPEGEVTAVRGPRLDIVLRPPEDLAEWERVTRPIPGGLAAELAAGLEAQGLEGLPMHGKGPQVWRGAVVRVGDELESSTFTGATAREPEALAAVLAAAFTLAGWDPKERP